MQSTIGMRECEAAQLQDVGEKEGKKNGWADIFFRRGTLVILIGGLNDNLQIPWEYCTA